MVSGESIVSELKPKQGDIVSFTYDNYSRTATPLNPKVYRIRSDLSWKHVLRDSLQEPQSQYLNGRVALYAFDRPYFALETTRKIFGESPKPFGYWMSEKRKNMRQFFEKIAISKNLDPLKPHTWYSLQQTAIKA